MTQATVYIYSKDGSFYWEAVPGSKPTPKPFKDRVAAYEHAKYCFGSIPFVVCVGDPLRLAAKATRTTGREMQPAPLA